MMRETKIWREFTALPPELQQQVADFISFLRTRSVRQQTKATRRTKLTSEPFIGMWRNRKEMQDSTVWMRNVRQREWMNRDA